MKQKIKITKQFLSFVFTFIIISCSPSEFTDELADEMPSELADQIPSIPNEFEIDLNEEESLNVEELEGNWFRAYNNKVWGGHNQPSFERGESHVNISFNSKGEFIKNITVLGTYEGTSIADTNAVFIELGNYTTDNENIEIILKKRSWWDSWHVDMKEFDTSDVTANKFKYKNMTYQITGEELKIEYFIETDLISDEQETPGLDKFEEVYNKQ